VVRGPHCRFRLKCKRVDERHMPEQRLAQVGISVSGGLATVDVMDFAGDLGIHPDSSAAVLDGQ